MLYQHILFILTLVISVFILSAFFLLHLLSLLSLDFLSSLFFFFLLPFLFGQATTHSCQRTACGNKVINLSPYGSLRSNLSSSLVTNSLASWTISVVHITFISWQIIGSILPINVIVKSIVCEHVHAHVVFIHTLTNNTFNKN